MTNREVVTMATVQYVELAAGRAAVIGLDNGAGPRRPNTFGPAGLASLAAAIDQVAGDDLCAVFVIGKETGFCAGADLSAGGMMRGGMDAREVGALGHATFRRLAELPFPSVAVLTGVALGGGLELALHCTYRVSTDTGGPYGLPETHLGLIPGWGGAYLLPRLVGPAAALKLIVENPLSGNRLSTPADALAMGLVDAVVAADGGLAAAVDWLERVSTGEIDVRRPGFEDWGTAVSRARAFVTRKIGDAFPAPGIAIGLVAAARDADRNAAFAAEDEALAACLESPEGRASLYAFNLVNQRGKQPMGKPTGIEASPVTRIGVVGGGLMASQIALLFAAVGKLPVSMVEIDADRATLTRDRLASLIAAELDRGRWSDAVAADVKSRISVSHAMESLRSCDLVIEAVFEEMAVKQQVFRDLEQVVAETCLLVTNTSGLSITEMSVGLAHPERVVGLHFFNPVARMPLVEIIAAERTDAPTLAAAFALAATLRKTAVRVADTPGFVVNRLLLRQWSVLFDLVDSGYGLDAVAHATDALGFPMNAFALLDLVGSRVALHLNETMHAAYPDRFPVSGFLRAVTEGNLRVLTGEGAFTPEVTALAAAEGQGDAAAARRYLEDALAEEVAIMLGEGVVSDASQIDLAMIVGAGWPLALGGICAYLDSSGVSVRVNGRAFGVLDSVG